MSLFHAYPPEASTPFRVFDGPARILSLRIANTQAASVKVKVYVSPNPDADDVYEGHAVFPATDLTATLTDGDVLDVPPDWHVYAWCDTAHGASFWITTE